MKKICFFLAVISVFMISMPNCYAEKYNIHADGEYTMSDVETVEIAQDRALNYAMQSAIEQAGVYVESYTKVINASVAQDEITVISSHVVKVIEKRFEKSIDSNNNIHIIVHIRAEVDTDDFRRALNKMAENRDLKNQYMLLETHMKEIENENRRLKQQLENTSDNREKITAAIQKNEKEFERIAPQLNKNRLEPMRIGIGGIYVNDTLQQVRNKLGVPEKEGVSDGPFTGSMYEYKYNDRGLDIIFNDGKVIVFSSSSKQGGYRTPDGIGVGDSASRLTEVYGAANAVRHYSSDNTDSYIYNEVFPILLFVVKDFKITEIMCGDIDGI